MNRRLKQFLYGIFYLAFFALIVWAVFGFGAGEPSSCKDGVRNRGEQGVDCGGPCAPCGVSNVESLEKGQVQVFQFGSKRSSVLSTLKNPNENAGADINYSLVIFGKEGTALKKFEGSGYVPPSGSYSVHNILTNLQGQPAEGELSLESVEWKEDESNPIEVTTSSVSLEEGSFVVEGEIENSSTEFWSEVELVAVFKDQLGFSVASSQTVLGGVEGFDSRNFRIVLPVGESLKGKVGLKKTEILINLRP